MRRGSPSDWLVFVLDLVFDVRAFDLQEKMSSFETHKVIAFVGVEKDSEQDFQVSCSDTDVSKYVRVVRSVENHDGLNVGWHLFLSSNLLN
jgi:hypothetical protein